MTATVAPPTERDFEAYRLVKIEQKSTRKAAELLELSQTRVCQIVQRVAEFLVEVAPVVVTEEHQAKQLNVARWVATERVDFLYGESIRSWQASKGPKTTVREVTVEGQAPVTVVLNRESQGDCKYLGAAQKYANAAGKMGAACWSLGDYSPGVQSSGETDVDREPKTAATPERDSGCETPPRIAPAPIVLRTDPVQSPTSPPREERPLTYRDVQARRDFLQAS